ncbi:histone-lysine N-methyltransferase, H3 lysine-9 specific SUVH4 isoform X2 [Cannabis sativa]|uniref:histone-lysine N-methyltransferase, H3 lysine-9 specific SUVH4 isoform X2 n=1 Tax=Cannabis sativa TaxID=3483 RepID=UPI0029C9EEB3|nr:histone-lysine N-methyltransferase, H3 lysine-9 specific SUVH4 isoform X2 [Cannabis sativa]
MVEKSLKCKGSIQTPIPNAASSDSSSLKITKCEAPMMMNTTTTTTTTTTTSTTVVVVKEEEPPSTIKRHSARIKLKQIAEKEVLVRKRVELLDHSPEVNGASKKKRRRVSPSSSPSLSLPSDNVAVVSTPKSVAEKNTFNLSESVVVVPTPVNLEGKSDHAKVRETLRLFNSHYLHLVQEEETRCARVVEDKKKSKGSKSKEKQCARVVENKKKSKASKSKKKVVVEVEVEDTKIKAKRPDLKAISKMIETKTVLFPDKRIGNIPGIDVGHQFYSRAEMVVVGFHSHWLNGIDYMGQAYSKGEYSTYTFPIAVAIVLSGMYEDDLDNADDVIYTGQGGHNLTGDKRQIKDQVLERGNLALKNCVDQGVPVRVVRGHESRSSYCGKVYTYDGLYKVVQYWAEKGISGFTVFKFRLKRLEGQPLLTTKQVQFSFGRVPQSLAEIQGLVCEDITGGQETIPIPATNLVDEPPVAPTDYKYLKSIQPANNVKLPSSAGGCDCVGRCVDPKTCACARLNGSDFPYVHRDGGRLIEAKDVVYECGPGCGCGPECVNRTSQKGLKYRFEVFRTPKKGWAVRSWDFIPSGAPICEYTGILRRTEDVDSVSGNDYIFDIDCLQTMKGLGGRERRSRDASESEITSSEKHEVSESTPEFCIDAGFSGNIARFINHSCGPNLFVQCVLHAHHDMKLARVMLFAADNIPPLQELTYDYGYALDSVLGPDGKVKQVPCYCGAADCKKRLY